MKQLDQQLLNILFIKITVKERIIASAKLFKLYNIIYVYHETGIFVLATESYISMFNNLKVTFSEDIL